QAKLRQMEIKAGMLSKRGGNAPGRARDYNIKSLRDAERAFVAQAEGAYVRFVAAWSKRPKAKQSAAKRPGREAARRGPILFPALCQRGRPRNRKGSAPRQRVPQRRTYV